MQLLHFKIISIIALTIMLGNHVDARARLEIITPQGVAQMNTAVTTMVDHIYKQLLPHNHSVKGLAGVWELQRDGPVDVALIDKRVNYKFTAKLKDAGCQSELGGEEVVTGELIGAHVRVEGFVDDVPECSIKTVKLQLLQPYTFRVQHFSGAKFQDKPEDEKDALKTLLEASINTPESFKWFEKVFNGIPTNRKECSEGMRTFIASHSA